MEVQLEYEIVAVYTLGGVFAGYTSKKVGVPKLQSVNLWSDEEKDELVNEVRRLNEKAFISTYWPEVDDPRVKALLDNPEFEPLTMTEVETIDNERSVLVPLRTPVWNDARKNEYAKDSVGNIMYEPETGEIDWEQSTIVYKKALAPDPAAAQQRFFKAMEFIARKDAGLG